MAWLRVVGAVMCCTLLLLLGLGCAPSVPPYFEGITPIVIEVGEGIAYRKGVRALDGNGREISFEVDGSSVDPNTPGVYIAVYHARDGRGMECSESVTVTVLPKPNVDPETLYSLLDTVILHHRLTEMDRGELASFLYTYVKSALSFTDHSDHTDWIAEAYRGLREGMGDCFTYCAVARAFFERCGVETMIVERMAGAREGTHFWLLVNVTVPEAPAWYHFDCCPHYRESPFRSCLLTDSELLAYNRVVENYYLFDQSLYPSTPTEPFR